MVNLFIYFILSSLLSLFVAAEHDNQQIVQLLIDANADLNAQDNNGETFSIADNFQLIYL
jgi:ankyrin repeat protein